MDDMLNLPEVESEFLNDFLHSFSRRRKALKYRFKDINCQKVYESINGSKYEKIEVTLSNLKTANKQRFKFDIWPDRWIWADGRKPSKKGWIWEWTYDGRLLPRISIRN